MHFISLNHACKIINSGNSVLLNGVLAASIPTPNLSEIALAVSLACYSVDVNVLLAGMSSKSSSVGSWYSNSVADEPSDILVSIILDFMIPALNV